MVEFQKSALTIEKAERATAYSLRINDRSSSAHRAWATMLLVGNGAGLLAAAGRVLQNPAIAPQLLLPSCWLFSAGIVAAALAVALEAVRLGLLSGAIARQLRRAHAGDVRPIPRVYGFVEDGGLFLRTLSEIISAALFLAAIWLPLAHLSGL